MNPPGNSAGGETPPSSQNQTQLRRPGQTHVAANNESHTINEPSRPFNDARGRRAPPSPHRPLEIEEPRQPPLGANQEFHIINEQVPPPHHAIAGRRTPPSWRLRLGTEDPRLNRPVVHFESPFISEPFLTYQEFLFINEEFLQPRRTADGREAPPWCPQRLGIPMQRLNDYRTYQEFPFINEPFLKTHRAADSRRTQPSPSSQRQLGIQHSGQPLSRVNNESLLYFAAGLRTRLRTRLQTSRYQFILQYKKEQLLRHQQHALRVNQESNTIKKPSPPLYSAGQRTSSRALRDQPLHQYQQYSLVAVPNATTLPRPSGEVTPQVKSLCAMPVGSDSTGRKRKEPHKDYSHSNISSAAIRSYLRDVRNRVEPMEYNANPFVPENNFLRHSSGLQSSNVVLPPPAAPSLANIVQLAENISGLQSPPWAQRRGTEEPRQTRLVANQECHNINQPFQPLDHHATDGRIALPSPSSQRQLGIQEPGQPPSRVNNESLTIRKPSRQLNSAGRRTGSQALKDQHLQHQQHALRVKHESQTIKKPSPPLYSTEERNISKALKDQLLQVYLKDQLLQSQKHALRVNQESRTKKKPSSSSEDRCGEVVARRCANCNNTSTTQWRSDPTGQKSLCNACGIRLNRKEETRAASGLESSSPLRDPREEESEMEEFGQNPTDKTRDNSP